MAQRVWRPKIFYICRSQARCLRHFQRKQLDARCRLSNPKGTSLADWGPVLNASYKLQLTLIAGTKNKEHRMCGIVLPVTLLRRLAPRCDFVLRLLRRTNVLVFVAKTKSTALHAAVETSNVQLLFVRSFSTPARLALLSRGRIYTFAGDYIAIAQPRQISRLPKSLDLCD